MGGPLANTGEIERFLAERWSSVEEDYRWKFPKELPGFVPLPAFSGNLFVATNELRKACVEAFKDQPEQVALWWVRDWGGVRAGNPDRIRLFAANAQDGLAPMKLSGVATWSKVLSIARPEQHAIYDARVALSLNALAMREGKSTYRVLLPNRNRKLTAAQQRLRDLGLARSCNPATPSDDYRSYLELLPTSQLDRHRAEMILFTYAEDLAEEIVERLA